jgi:hypothetical protein
MANNETTPDLELETEEIEETETEVAASESEPKDWQAEAIKLRAILSRKAKKEEKKETSSTPELKTELSLSRDEVVLLARGYDDEAIKKLKAIATANSTSLSEAENDDMFVAWKEKVDAEKKASKARLGASKGSAQAEAKKSYKSGMSKEDHKEIWRSKMGH